MGVHDLKKRGQSPVPDRGDLVAGVATSDQRTGLCGRRRRGRGAGGGAAAAGGRVSLGQQNGRGGPRKLPPTTWRRRSPRGFCRDRRPSLAPLAGRALLLTLQREEQQRRQRAAPRSHAGAAGSAPAARSALLRGRGGSCRALGAPGKPGPPRLAAGSQTAPRGGHRRARKRGKCSSRAAPLRGG